LNPAPKAHHTPLLQCTWHLSALTTELHGVVNLPDISVCKTEAAHHECYFSVHIACMEI